MQLERHGEIVREVWMEENGGPLLVTKLEVEQQ